MCYNVIKVIVNMERQVFVNELKQMRLIAHRLGYQMTDYPENSIEVLREIFGNEELLNACDGFEFDICFTKEHVPVVIHDKYIDDISDSFGLVAGYTLEELRRLNFKFRKSLKSDKNFITYKIMTLEELLTFFEDNIVLLKNKVIKIETKDYIFTNKNNFSRKNLLAFAEVINKFPNLSKNIVHLSFWPLNLCFLKKIQRENKFKVIKSDFLCDYSILVFLTRFMPCLDNISLRIKTNRLVKSDRQNSKMVNKKIRSDLFWMRLSNALKEKNLKYAINKYGMVGLYTLNDYEEIDEICKHISTEFLKENSKKIVITTNNPVYLKNIK